MNLAHDSCDQVIDYVNYWNGHAEIPAKQIVAWLGIGGSKYIDWKKRCGKAIEHNGAIPRDHWLEEAERKAIVDFYAKIRLEVIET